jgi:AraC family transcriptional regulator
VHAYLTSGLTNDEEFCAGAFAMVGTEHAPHLSLRRHDHELATIVVVREGEFDETVGARIFHCVPGAVLIKPAGAHHSNAYGATGSTAVLAAVPNAYAIRDVICFRNPSAVRRLSFEFRHRDAASAAVCEGILLELIDRDSAEPARLHRQVPQWLLNVEELLRCDAPIAIATLATAVGRDPIHLAREFRRHFGMSPGHYARSARIERSCALLRGTDEPIAAIALSTGFYDQSHFTNAFRRIVRLTPAEYRRRAHGSSKTRSVARR